MVSEGIPIGDNAVTTVIRGNQFDYSGILAFMFVVILIIIFVFLVMRKKDFKDGNNVEKTD